MKPDDVIATRKQWVRAAETMMFQGPKPLPATTVLASRDWLVYVCAMADAVPDGQDLLFPTEKDVKWPWPGGVTIVFDEPLNVDHMIVSRDRPDGSVYSVKPRAEQQLTRGLAIGTQAMTAAAIRVGDVRVVTGLAPSPDDKITEIETFPLAWFGDDPYDIITGRWLPNTVMHAIHSERISQASRMLLAVLTAMGHRLTRIDEPETENRGERRRIHRDLPSLRVIRLATGASAKRSEGTGTVEWNKRWIVRGHWHTVVHGPNRSLRKVQWYDPYVKGPEDKPLDDRDTIWKA
jgi:hypothetical protein